jgi:hypothetical protein
MQRLLNKAHTVVDMPLETSKSPGRMPLTELAPSHGQVRLQLYVARVRPASAIMMQGTALPVPAVRVAAGWGPASHTGSGSWGGIAPFGRRVLIRTELGIGQPAGGVSMNDRTHLFKSQNYRNQAD